MRRFILAVALTALVAVPAFADVRIMSSAGGPVVPYLEFYSKVRRSGERVVIDGPCLSACTLVLSTIPRNRICVTSRAVLGFHAPIVADRNGRKFHSREITRAINATYPPAVRAWIKTQWRLDTERDPAEGPRARQALSALLLRRAY